MKTVRRHWRLLSACAAVLVVAMLSGTVLGEYAFAALHRTSVTSRPLTHDEAKFVKHFFGIDPTSISIVAGAVHDGRAYTTHALSPGHYDIVVPANQYRHGGRIQELPAALLAHETTHVWQIRREPVATWVSALHNRGIESIETKAQSEYDLSWKDVQQHGFMGLGMEQQAVFVEDFITGSGVCSDGARLGESDDNPWANDCVGVLHSVFPFHVRKPNLKVVQFDAWHPNHEYPKDIEGLAWARIRALAIQRMAPNLGVASWELRRPLVTANCQERDRAGSVINLVFQRVFRVNTQDGEAWKELHYDPIRSSAIIEKFPNDDVALRFVPPRDSAIANTIWQKSPSKIHRDFEHPNRGLKWELRHLQASCG